MGWDIQHLFHYHAAGIRRSLQRVGFSADVAEDLVQDTFLRVMSHPPASTAVRHNPKAYLYQTSRTIGINHRSRQRRVEVSDPAAFDQIADVAPSAERVVAGRQQMRRVEAALAAMPDRMRTAFEMHRMDGMTIADVAARIGLSTTRTWGLVHEAYRHLLACTDE